MGMGMGRLGSLTWRYGGFVLNSFRGACDGRRVCGLHLWVRRDGCWYGRTLICLRY